MHDKATEPLIPRLLRVALVVAGRLRVEVLTWMVEKGALAFPKAAPIAETR